MRTLRTITTAALVALLALPAAAADCSELEITQRDVGGPIVTGHTPGDGVYTSVNGTFLWVYIGDEAPADMADNVSVDISDRSINGATVCPDGNVTLHRAEPDPVVEDTDEVAPLPEVTGLGETVDLAEVFADYQPFIDALLRVRPLG